MTIFEDFLFQKIERSITFTRLDSICFLINEINEANGINRFHVLERNLNCIL